MLQQGRKRYRSICSPFTVETARAGLEVGNSRVERALNSVGTTSGKGILSLDQGGLWDVFSDSKRLRADKTYSTMAALVVEGDSVLLGTCTRDGGNDGDKGGKTDREHRLG